MSGGFGLVTSCTIPEKLLSGLQYEVTGVCSSSAPPAQEFLQPVLSQASLLMDHIVLILGVKKKQRLRNHCPIWGLEVFQDFLAILSAPNPKSSRLEAMGG